MASLSNNSFIALAFLVTRENAEDLLCTYLGNEKFRVH